MKSKLPSKYDLYEASVQDPPEDVKDLAKFYRDAFKGRDPQSFREDFCGTFCLSAAWVASKPTRTALGVDLDKVPLKYGFDNHWPKLSKEQQKRLDIRKANVLEVHRPAVDLIAALNFSYSVFKKREQLLAYLKNSYRNLKPKGVFVMDTVSGEDILEPHTDTRGFKVPGYRKHFRYFWEQSDYNALTNEVMCHIHFATPNGRKMKNAFTYDWRLWTVPELRDLMQEAGFDEVHVYCEGDSKNGLEGNGIFSRKTYDESCEVWLAYVIGVKR